jgi:flagellar hook-associated protein 3 FlgL
VRITSNAIQRETLATIRNSMSEIAEAQRRVTTGKRVNAPSDDPVAAGAVLRTRRQTRALAQYARNIDHADARLRSEEMVIEEVTHLLSRAKELGVRALGPHGMDGDALEAMAAEAQELFEAAIQAGNTPFGSGYLFGGSTPDQEPILSDGSVRAEAAGPHHVDIGGSSWFRTNHDGDELFRETGVLDVLGGLADALSAAAAGGDTTEVGTRLSELDTAFDELQSKLAEVGARTNRLEVARSNVEALDLNLQTLQSDLEDADLEEAVSDLVGRQMAYQAALLATSKILSTTLTDYLR